MRAWFFGAVVLVVIGAVLMIIGYFMPLAPTRLYLMDDNIFQLASQRAANGILFPVLYIHIDLALTGFACFLLSLPAFGVAFYEYARALAFFLLKRTKARYDSYDYRFIAHRSKLGKVWLSLTIASAMLGLTFLLLGYFVPVGSNRLYEANINLFTLAVLPYNPFGGNSLSVQPLIGLALTGFSFFIVSMPCFFFFGSEKRNEYRTIF